jgi:hypothetical protein
MTEIVAWFPRHIFSTVTDGFHRLIPPTVRQHAAMAVAPGHELDFLADRVPQHRFLDQLVADHTHGPCLNDEELHRWSGLGPVPGAPRGVTSLRGRLLTGAPAVSLRTKRRR